MFNNISWQSYWIAIALLTAGYYLLIYLLFFRKDFEIKWSRNTTSEEESLFASTTSDNSGPIAGIVEQPTMLDKSEEFQVPAKGTIENAVYVCLDEINAYLEEAKRTKCVKEELLYALQSILRKYPALLASEYKESVTTVLINQCQYHCSVHLSVDDVVKVWVEG